jgi:predicted MFS family arabinose efflux permease
MNNYRATALQPEAAKGAWGEIFRNGLGLYSALVIGGIAMQATQMLVIAIIMPTHCRRHRRRGLLHLGRQIYTIGAIVGASSTGVIWSRFGPRRGYALGAGVFALSTAACALAPDIGALIAARAQAGPAAWSRAAAWR